MPVFRQYLSTAATELRPIFSKTGQHREVSILQDTATEASRISSQAPWTAPAQARSRADTNKGSPRHQREVPVNWRDWQDLNLRPLWVGIRPH